VALRFSNCAVIPVVESLCAGGHGGSPTLPPSAATENSICRSLASASDQKRKGHRQQRQRIFVASITGEESTGPMNSRHGSQHCAGNKERADSSQKPDADQKTADKFRKSGGS
jgi:hypothetical protein